MLQFCENRIVCLMSIELFCFFLLLISCRPNQKNIIQWFSHASLVGQETAPSLMDDHWCRCSRVHKIFPESPWTMYSVLNLTNCKLHSMSEISQQHYPWGFKAYIPSKKNVFSKSLPNLLTRDMVNTVLQVIISFSVYDALQRLFSEQKSLNGFQRKSKIKMNYKCAKIPIANIEKMQFCKKTILQTWLKLNFTKFHK